MSETPVSRLREIAACLQRLRIEVCESDDVPKQAVRQKFDVIYTLLGDLGEALREIEPPDRPSAADPLARSSVGGAETSDPESNEGARQGTGLSGLPELLGETESCYMAGANIDGRDQPNQSEQAPPAFLQPLIHLQIIGAYLIDHQGRIINANDIFLQLIGYKRDDILTGGLHEDDLIPPEYKQFDEWAKEHWRLTGIYPTYEKEYLCNGGKRITVLAKTSWLTVDACEFGLVFVINSSERKRLEQKLKLTQLFIDDSEEIILWIGRQQNILYASRAASTFFGYSENELLSLQLSDIVQTTGGANWEAYRAKVTQGEACTQEFFVRQAAGEWHLVEGSIWSLASGDETYLQVSFSNPAERMHIEERLRESERRYREFATQVDVGVWCFVFEATIPVTLPEDEQIDSLYRYGNLAECNDALARMYGCETADELIGAGLDELLTKSDPANVAYLRAFIQAGYKLSDQEIQKLTPSGEIRYFLNNLVGILQNGELVQVWGSQRDITDRKKIEAHLKEQAALLDQANDAILVRDLDHRVIFWNKGAEHVYGWSADEIVGKKTVDYLFQTDDLPRFDQAMRELLETGRWSGEWHHRTKNGSEIIVESRWALVRDDQGKPRSILVIDTDITEKKRLKEQFLRAQRLESIGAFSATIAHDLNNVLSPILMTIEVLRKMTVDEEVKYFLARLKLSTERGAALIQQVLAYAKGVPGSRMPLQLKYTIHEMLGILLTSLPKNIKLHLDLQEDLWVIMADATQMHQVFMNLCVNAKDAMPDGGVISIYAENRIIDDHHKRGSGRYVVITVADTGTGITPDIQGMIFEPFFTTKAHGKGTGLGLSATLSIIESHGGFIDLNSDRDRGTTFKVYLPASPESIFMSSVDIEEALPAGRGETLLIVADESNILIALKSGLEMFGYEVLTVGSVSDAITLYASNQDRIQVVLIDLAMPDRDGYELIRELQKHEPGMKIIVTSGLPLVPELLELVQKNVLGGYLGKPFSLGDLLRLLDNILHTPS